MLRADMDALPVTSRPAYDYARPQTASCTPVDTTCTPPGWSARTSRLSAARDDWKGTVMAVFQPAEETAAGAQAMIDDGLFERFPKPDVILGQHVMPSSAGSIGTRSGVITSAADSFEIRMFGRGAHGSMPEASIDPVVMAASTVMRLQTIVSREVAASKAAVVTVGALQAGTKENVIPDEAVIKLNVRTFDEDVRKHVLDAIKRIVEAEAQASGSPKPPEITPLDHYSAGSKRRRCRRPRANRIQIALRRRAGHGTFRQSRPARTSVRLAPSGTRRPCSGPSVAPTQTCTAKPSRKAGFPSSRPTTTHGLLP